MNEATLNFLNGLGIEKATIDALSGESLPDDFDMEQHVNSFLDKRKELVLNDSETMRGLKQKFNNELYPAIIKPINKKLKDIYGFSAEDMQSFKGEDGHIDTKAMIAAGVEKLKKDGSSNLDAERQKMFELQKMLDDQKTSYEDQLNSVKNDYETKIKNGKIERQFNKYVNGLEYSINREYVPSMMMHAVNSKYNLDFDESGNLVPLNKDGSKATDGKNFLNIADVVKAEAEAMKILKKSNGGESGTGSEDVNNTGGGNKQARKPVDTSKLSANAQRLIALAEKQNKNL